MELLGQTIIPSGDGAGQSYADACRDKQFLEKAAKSKAAGRASLAAFAKAQLASQAVDMLTICAGNPVRSSDPPSAPGALAPAQPLPFSRKTKEPSSAPEQAAVGFKLQMEFLVTTIVSAVLTKFNASHLQHTTKALLVLAVTLILLPRVWLIFLEFGVRAVSQLFWMTLGSIVRSVERELQTACGFTELALRTFVEHVVSMAIPSYKHEGHSTALSLPTPINYTSVSRPDPYPTLLVSYNTAGVTYLLWRTFRH